MNNMQEVRVSDFEKDICKYSTFIYARKDIWRPMNIEIKFNIAAVGFTTRPYLIFQNDTSVMHIHSIKKVYKREYADKTEYIFHCDTETDLKGHTGKYVIECI